MAKMHEPKSLRDQLAPLIYAEGVREVARRSGVPQPRISEWLAGKRGMIDERVEAIATAVGVRLITRKAPKS